LVCRFKKCPLLLQFSASSHPLQPLQPLSANARDMDSLSWWFPGMPIIWIGALNENRPMRETLADGFCPAR
jgi:hypothetical protein